MEGVGPAARSCRWGCGTRSGGVGGHGCQVDRDGAGGQGATEGCGRVGDSELAGWQGGHLICVTELPDASTAGGCGGSGQCTVQQVVQLCS